MAHATLLEAEPLSGGYISERGPCTNLYLASGGRQGERGDALEDHGGMSLETLHTTRHIAQGRALER